MMIAGSVIDEVRVVDERLRRLVSKHLVFQLLLLGGVAKRTENRVGLWVTRTLFGLLAGPGLCGSAHP
jgi:hypothetical protein